MRAKFLEAGHMLGSAQIQIDIDTGLGNKHRLVFSGDIGRSRRAILREPEIPSDTETLIMESTYGNRTSPPPDDLRDELRSLVQRVSERGGKIIIPAFSVGRTQEVVYQLNALFNEGSLPRIPIFVDSPLSANVTEVFRNHPECYNRETRDIMMDDPDVFGFSQLTYIRSAEESKALNHTPGPFIVISASGMCEHGRILHHLRNSIEQSRNCVLIVGYQAENTLGRRIVERQPTVRIFGEEHALRAEVKVLNGFSAHADMNELRDYAFRVHARSAGKLKRIYLVHGEDEPQNALAEYLRTALKIDVFIPGRGDSIDL
jgi:metallo-beta-lactamase family protein